MLLPLPEVLPLYINLPLKPPLDATSSMKPSLVLPDTICLSCDSYNKICLW